MSSTENASVLFSQNSMDHFKTVWKIYGSKEAGKSDETVGLSLVQLNAMKMLLVLTQEQFKRLKIVSREQNAAKIKVKSLALRFVNGGLFTGNYGTGKTVNTLKKLPAWERNKVLSDTIADIYQRSVAIYCQFHWNAENGIYR